MFRRMRSRLFISFLTVSILAMIPLFIVPYFIASYFEEQVREERLKNEFEQFRQQTQQFHNLITTHVLIPTEEHLLNSTFVNRPELKNHLIDLRNRLPQLTQADYDRLRERINAEMEEGQIHSIILQEMKNNLEAAFLEDPYEKQIRNQLLQNLQNNQIVTGQDYRLLDSKEYIAESKVLNSDDQIKRLIEEDGTVYSWFMHEIFVEEEGRRIFIGGLMLRLKYIDLTSREDGRVQKIAPMLVDSPISIVKPDKVLFRSYLEPQEFETLFDENRDGQVGNVGHVRMQHPLIENGEYIQAGLVPLFNQDSDLIAVMVVSEPVINFLKPMILLMVLSAPFTLFVIMIVATFVARSLAWPIRELADASQTMAEGRFDVRVPVSGTEEQRVLSTAFNRMAQRIEQQMAQLQRQTNELEESNRELAQTHRFLKNVLANIFTGVLSVDRNGNIRHLNPVGETLFMLSDWAGKSLQAVIPSPAFVDLVVSALHTQKSVYRMETSCQIGDDAANVIPLQISIMPMREEGELTGLVVTFHDLSEIRRLEDQIRRQDRLAALGRMSAGVAHEIRNPLGIIRGSAQLLHKRFSTMEGEEGLSMFIIEEVNRLSRVVNDFLMFARPPMPVKDEMDVPALMEQLQSYMQSEHEHYRFRIEVEPGVPPIAVDAGLFREAFLNLILNAQEAMPDGGEVILRACTWGDDSVALEVIDHGMGISPEQIDRIFDPFYTSKDNGTGLGLSLVHQIVSSHEGTIEVVSNPGEGSTFRVVVPARLESGPMPVGELATTS